MNFVDTDIGISAGEYVNADARKALLNPKNPVANTDIDLKAKYM